MVEFIWSVLIFLSFALNTTFGCEPRINDSVESMRGDSFGHNIVSLMEIGILNI